MIPSREKSRSRGRRGVVAQRIVLSKSKVAGKKERMVTEGRQALCQGSKGEGKESKKYPIEAKKGLMVVKGWCTW